MYNFNENNLIMLKIKVIISVQKNRRQYCQKHVFTSFRSNQGMIYFLSRRRTDTVISRKLKSHSKIFLAFLNNAQRVVFRYISEYSMPIFRICWTELPFRPNFLFGYGQSGLERTSFSGSTVL